MVLAKGTLFIAGPPDVVDEEESLAAFARPDTQEQLARQAALLEGSEGGTLRAVSAPGQGTKVSVRVKVCQGLQALVRSS